MPAKIQLRSKVNAAEAEAAFLGKMMDEESYDVLVTGDADVFKPNGERLASLVKNCIPPPLYENCTEALHALKSYGSDNRGTYAGLYSERRRARDGTLSKRMVSVDLEGKRTVVPSAVVGFFERQPQTPFCRATRFVAHELTRWRTLIPLVQHVGRVFAERFPGRHAVQEAIARRTEQSFVIEGSPFTTLTVNNTVRAAGHRDAGDLKAGFGCITAMRTGKFDGFYLVFPEYRVAVDVGPFDVLLFDPHEIHGNTAMKNAEEGAERISVVYYYREKMQQCGSLTEELAQAKKRGLID